jgi:hypothetical protein
VRIHLREGTIMISHAKRNPWAAATLAALLGATPALGAQCLGTGAVFKTGPKFSDYAVGREKAVRPAPVVLASREARQFRSMLREAAKAGPNFAGHYTIAGWGCGTSCLDWGIVDALTGKVTFDAKLRVLETPSGDWTNYGALTKSFAASGANTQSFDLLLFRRDSALLVMLGEPGEDETRDGVRYLHWTGIRFEQVKFVPATEICRAD